MPKSPWGSIGAWAADAEREEAEERAVAEKAAAHAAQSGGGVGFPSLKDAANAKQKKKTKMTLQEFTMQSAYAAGRDLTAEEMLRLPTGPKERSSDEMQYGRLGGGFSSYGSRLGGGFSSYGGSGQGMDRGREFDGGRRSYGFEDENRRGRNQARVSEFNQMQQPNRADGVDNWGSMKKSKPEYDSILMNSGGMYGSLGGNAGVGGSRADGVDNWTSVKKSISQPHQQQYRMVLESPKNEIEVVVKSNKLNPFGMARPREEVLTEKGLDWKKLEMDLEVKKQQHSVGRSRPTSSHSSRPGSSHSSRSEPPVASLPGTAEVLVKQKPKVNPFGDAKPREVVLEEKGLDWKKIDLDLEHRRVERPQTEGEKNLKEEIERLNKELLKKSGENQTSVNEIILQKQRELDLLKRQLDDNVRYSQKVFERHGTGRDASFHDRSHSRAGPGFHDQAPTIPGMYVEHRTGYPERHHSQSGMYEDPRAEFPERAPSQSGAYGNPKAGFRESNPSHTGAYEDPRLGYSKLPHSRSRTFEDPKVGFHQRSSLPSGGYQEPRAVDHGARPHSQAKPIDDRRAFQTGGGGRGILGCRDVGRSGSRW